MSSSHQVELEAAKFLHKLIQDSKDEPTKLAEKLHVILGHMKMSGKEQSLPYQVISRAMETVVSQHKIDIKALKSSRLAMGNMPPIGDSSRGASVREKSKEESSGQTSQNIMSSERKEAGGTSDPAKIEYSRQNTLYRGSFAQPLEHESSASVPMEDSSAASDAPPRRKEAKKKGNAKRKRADSKESSEVQGDDSQQLDSAGTRFSSLKGKQSTRVVAQSHLSVRDGEHSQVDSIQQGSQIGQGTETKRQFKGIGEREAKPLPLQKIENTSTYQLLAANMPFKEQHLKQLRAQCLVFLAFRNNVPPRKLHLEIALGEKYPKEDGNHQGSVDAKGHYPESPASQVETESSSRDTDKNNQSKAVVEQHLSSSEQKTELSHVESEYLAKSIENDGDRVNQLANLANQPFPSSLRNSGSNTVVPPSTAIAQREMASDGRVNPKQPKPFIINERKSGAAKLEFPIFETNMAGDRNPSLSATSSHSAQVGNSKSAINSLRESQHEKPSAAAQCAIQENKVGVHTVEINGSDGKRTSEMQKLSVSNGLKTIIFCDASRVGTVHQGAERSIDHDDDSSSVESLDTPLSPPQVSTSEKWIIVQKKRKSAEEEEWVSKQMKAEKQITTCFEKLKENVNASEDISTKTKSVIELKKLQLLQVQRRLRSEFLSDFFKPISSEMEHLKSIKKHRHPRKTKQLERFELKMKEERQKRIRERQKEFFGEIEAHKERLEDCFKIKRERFKGINRYIKEFHKRKERIYREKIDRIQREKINLLKANDVEGYLRMVQDAKSDRVKQLLKETEKYLQKLGAKIKEAKCMTRFFGEEMNGSDAAMSEKNEICRDPGDENDQAQNYLESNEKYYLLAHSVKETIEEQPASLRGGKLREYQMNGLRWLVSLYNNHLNGILADEMGLGKTVQVISLICYLMETKNDRGPFLVVVPSSVLPGWDSEISFWAPGINKIMYSGTPEERRRLFKERIAHRKFNVLLTTYEYLMNKHDRPKLSKIDWHYVIIDEGHRIKNASCKLNADLKHYRSNHRLLLTGTPLQNNLEELWALLNFLLPNIFNSAEDFSQWFNKPFQSNNDGSADEALLSEEENLLIINRLHQVLRPFVLRRLKHKVENELPEKIERLVRCEASAYQKLLMKRVEDNLGSIGNSKGRSVHNTVMELRNICNHPYLSQLHADEVDALLPKHYLPPLVRLCGKMEMVDRLLPKLKATGHRVLFFSTMTRLLDVMEEYLHWKNYRYLRLDGHTSGSDRGALIEEFNRPDSPTFIFLLSIRAGGVGVNLQAADTVLIFDTDWNPQVDLQAQARAHRIGQKRDVLVLRLETVNTVEEQVRAAAEHKLGVANQSITAGFFDNNTSAEDRREYLESLLRECKKEEAAPVLDDDALNDLLARSEEEIDVFESIDRKRRELEAATWQKLTTCRNIEGQILPMPPRLVTEEDLEPLYKVFHLSDTPVVIAKRKRDANLDTQHYGRGKRAREVRSYEDQWTEEEFEKLCQAESPGETLKTETLTRDSTLPEMEDSGKSSSPSEPLSGAKENLTPVKRGRGRPKRLPTDTSLPCEPPDTIINLDNVSSVAVSDLEHSKEEREMVEKTPMVSTTATSVSLSKASSKAQCRKTPSGEASRGRGKKSSASGRAKASKCSPVSFNAQSLEHKEESTKEAAKETSPALPSPLVLTQESQDAQVLSKLSEAEPMSTSPALITHTPEKKVSITRKKAAAREARNMGGSKTPSLKQKTSGSSEGISGNSQLSCTQDHGGDVQESSSMSKTYAKEKISSLADVGPSSREKDSKPDEIKESSEHEEFASENVHNPLEQTSVRKENSTGISLVVQLNGEKITKPSLTTVPFSVSLAAEEHRLESTNMSDQIRNSEPEDPDSFTQEVSALENRSTPSAACDDSVDGAQPIVDSHVETDNSMETRDLQCKGMMLTQKFDDLADVAETNMPVCRDEDRSGPVGPQPACLVSDDNSQDHDNDAPCFEDEGHDMGLPLKDKIHNNDATCPEICSTDATHADDEGIDVNAPPENETDYDATCIQHDDKNQNYDASVSLRQIGDDTCTRVEGNETGFPSQDKNQDYDALPLERREVVISCSKDEGDDVTHALPDENEEHSASASTGHATDAACISNDGNAVVDKNQDFAASISDSLLEDATCIKDDDNTMPDIPQVQSPGFEPESTSLHHGSAYDNDRPMDSSLTRISGINISSEQPIADVDNTYLEHPITEQPITDVDSGSRGQPIADVDSSSVEPPVADMDALSPENPVVDADNSSLEQVVADSDSPLEQPIADVDDSSAAQPVADMDTSPPEKPTADVGNSSLEQDAADVENPLEQSIADEGNSSADPSVADVESPGQSIADMEDSSAEPPAGDVERPYEQPTADVDNSSADLPLADVEIPRQLTADQENSSSDPVGDVENPREQPIADVDTSGDFCIADVRSSEQSISDVANSHEQPITDGDNSYAGLPVADVENPQHFITDAENSSGDPAVADVEVFHEQPIADADNSSADLPVADVENAEQTIADVENTPAVLPVAVMENTSAESPVADVESFEQPIPDVDNTSSEPPVADMASHPELPVADVDSTAETPVAEVDDSSPDLAAADVDKTSVEPPVADVDNTSVELPFADANKSLDLAAADMDSSEQPIADMDKSLDQDAVDMESSEQPIVDVEITSSEPPVSDVDNSYVEQAAADVENPPELLIADVENTSAEPPVAAGDNSSLEQAAADGKNPSERPTADVDYSSVDPPVADMDSPSLQNPITEADNSSPKKLVADVDSSSPELVPDMNNSSEEQPVADVDTPFHEESMTVTEDSSSEPLVPREQGACSENTAGVEFSDPSAEVSEDRGISGLGNNTAVSEASQGEDDQISDGEIPRTSVDEPSV